ncbi:MAG: hypothetical protein U0263_05680 [Polyangiaceae bacterium]
MAAWKQSFRGRGLGGALVFVLAGVPTAAPHRAGTEDSGDRAVRTEPRTTGQWIWTSTDLERYQGERGRTPDLVPAVLVGTLTPGSARAFRRSRGLSPARAGDRVGLVLRFDDALREVFEREPRTAVDDELAEVAREVVGEAEATGVTVSELQLDFDAPVRLLPRWAEAAGRVANSLRVPVWVTSIPAHLYAREYGALFHDRVAGHVIQLFDLGIPCTSPESERLRRALARARLPFRIGSAAFERAGRPTEHACFRKQALALREVPGYSGDWLFPGGEDPRAAFAELAQIEER